MLFLPNPGIEWRVFYFAFSSAYIGAYALLTGGLLALLLGSIVLSTPNLLLNADARDEAARAG